MNVKMKKMYTPFMKEEAEARAPLIKYARWNEGNYLKKKLKHSKMAIWVLENVHCLHF